MVDGLHAGPGDRGVSWLPLYHDMGLIGFGLAPLLTRTPVTFIPRPRFVRQPSAWLTTLSETRATITFAPNFAYSLVTRPCSPEGLDLSHVRLWGCGAEPVSEKVLAAFEAKFAQAKMDAEQEMQAAVKELEEAIETERREKGQSADVRGKLTELQMQQRYAQRRLQTKISKLEQNRDRDRKKFEQELNQQIVSVQNAYKTLAVTLPPVPPLVVGLIVFLRRRRRELEGVVAERRRS